MPTRFSHRPASAPVASANSACNANGADACSNAALLQFPRRSHDGALDPNVDFHHPVKVMMPGLVFPRIGEAGPFLSLEDFDERKVYGPNEVVFNSPRSVTACLRMGIYPSELIKQPLVLTPGVDLDVVKMRYVHQERRRKQKLRLLMEERSALTIEDCEASRKVASPGTAAQNEEQHLQRIVAANQARYRQQLLREERTRHAKEHWNKRLEQQRQREEEAAEQRRREQQRHDADSEARAAEIREMRAAERLVAEEELQRKQVEYAMLERRRQEQQEKKKRLMEKEHRQVLELAQQRQQAIREQFQRQEEERLSQYMAKLERTEQAQQEFEEQKEERQLKAQETAKQKSHRVQAALERSRQLDCYRVAVVMERQQKAEEAKQRIEAEWQQEVEERRQREAEREQHRRDALAAAKRLEQERREEIERKMETVEEKQRRLKEERDQQRLRKAEEERLQQADKLENVERMKKVEEFQRFQLLQRIREKAEKAEELAELRETLKQKRKEQREEVERNKVICSSTSPGPGEYSAPPTAGYSPCWKFGMAHGSIKSIVGGKGFVKHLAGKDSPGPAAYDLQCPLLLKNKAHSVPRADRFTAPVCVVDPRKGLTTL